MMVAKTAPDRAAGPGDTYHFFLERAGEAVKERPRISRSVRGAPELLAAFVCLLSAGCAAVSTTYDVAKGTCDVTVGATKTVYHGVRGTYNFAAGTTRTVYKIGEFTFEVVQAPLDWPLLNDDIETIDGLPVKEAIRQGRVKASPYTVGGRTYYPMSVDAAQSYREVGIASWYGYETRRKRGGYMTANGEAFNPKALTAAHKLLPLPTNVRVTNLENNRSIIVRVNDRGPFPCKENPRSGDRIIDLSMGAAKRLGFYEQGTVRVRVETVQAG